jgi:hypothetical protein
MEGESTPIEWARAEAGRLREVADSAHVASLSVSNSTVRALQFFSDHASGTTFEAINASRHYQRPAEPFEKMAFQLEEWATYQESGMANLKPFDVRFRIEAATDIMELVHLLLKDPELHSAAAVVLAGAALQEFLRSMQFDCGEPIKGKPGISVYAEALRKADLLTRGEVKDIIGWADQRNDAAHGEFGEIAKERTLLMVDGIHLFLSKHTDSN